jgi:glutathione peroxidase
MRTLLATLACAAALNAATVHDFTLSAIDGKPAPLAQYKGKVLLLVNVASQCGYTPQYAGLEKLYQQYKGRGLVVLGFPANDFGSQEPGSNEEIRQFCTRKYNVTFPMYAKSAVKGPAKNPLYQWLTDTAQNPTGRGDVKWNFTKFLVGKDGKVITRFDSGVAPDAAELTAAVEKALQ